MVAVIVADEDEVGFGQPLIVGGAVRVVVNRPPVPTHDKRSMIQRTEHHVAIGGNEMVTRQEVRASQLFSPIQPLLEIRSGGIRVAKGIHRARKRHQRNPGRWIGGNVNAMGQPVGNAEAQRDFLVRQRPNDGESPTIEQIWFS